MSFQTYDKYREVDIGWIRDVPAHWKTLPLKRVAELIVEPARHRAYQVGLEHVEGWSGNLLGTTTEFAGDGIGFRAGDVLFGKLRPYLAKVHLAESSGAAVGDFFVLRPSGINPSYFHRYILNPAVIRGLDAFTIGAKMPRVSWRDMALLPVALPPEHEQLKIAAFLGHESAKIDALVAEQKRLIELLKEKRQAVISHAVTKGLDPNVPMKDSGVEWLGDVPAHWLVGSLRWYAEIQGGIAKGKDYTGKDVVEIPYLRVTNVQNGHIDLKDVAQIAALPNDLERYALRDGDVLMNEGGDNDKLGRGAVWHAEIDPCLHQNHVFAIRPGDHLHAEWLALFTSSESARSYFYLYSKQSTNLASISSSNVMSCPIPLPVPKEQEEILESVRQSTDSIDEMTAEASKAIDLLTERRSALISAAVTGKVDVRDWQPAEEVAENTTPLPMAAEERARYQTSR